MRGSAPINAAMPPNSGVEELLPLAGGGKSSSQRLSAHHSAALAFVRDAFMNSSGEPGLRSCSAPTLSEADHW